MDLRRKNLAGTLVFPVREDLVLLGLKTKKIGEGQWNGWGGGQKEGESIRQTACRELKEESGFSARLEDLEHVGKVLFHNFKDGRYFDVEVHMFLMRVWEGGLRPNKEMANPTWWRFSELPFGEMLPSDPDWMPQVLRGEWIEGETWQEWVKEPDGHYKVGLTRPSVVKKVDKLGDVD